MSRWLPPAASAHAGEIDFVLLLVHILMFALFAGWTLYFTWVLFRFRRKRQPSADPRGATGRLAVFVEAGVVIAEVVLLVVFALPLWFQRTSARPNDPNAIVIRVVAEQFVWNVHYPGGDGQFGPASVGLISPTNPLGLDRSSSTGRDDIVLLSQIHLPVNRPVIIQLSTKDVIHSFGLPEMRVKQDAIPGFVMPVWFIPNRVGDYEIACSQLCGLGHFRMRGFVNIKSEADYKAFLDEEAKNLTQ